MLLPLYYLSVAAPAAARGTCSAACCQQIMLQQAWHMNAVMYCMMLEAFWSY
jgi:hypothetical protein